MIALVELKVSFLCEPLRFLSLLIVDIFIAINSIYPHIFYFSSQ